MVQRRGRQLLVSGAALVLCAQGVSSAGAFSSPVVDVRVDANRDGEVDLVGLSDADDAVATARSGAIFLPNVDDDAQRCVTSDQDCHDAADQVVNGVADAADLAPVHIMPMQVSSAEVTFSNQHAVNVFWWTEDQWKFVPTGTQFTANQLASGVQLGVEGKDIVRDLQVWDGTVTVTVTASTGSSDSAQLMVAPMLSHHHGQVNERIVASPRDTPQFTQFANDLAEASGAAGVPKPLHLFADSHDQWTQDWFEPMYVSMPRTQGASTMRLLMRSDQGRTMQDRLYELRGPSVGVVKLSDRPHGGTRSSLGNLETIPPHPGFPAGRIIVGDASVEGPSPTMMSILAAQSMQQPLLLDTSWLYVGHVDEFVQFLPADDGVRVAVADPRGAVALLDEAVRAGHGRVAAGQRGELARKTLQDLVRDRSFRADNEKAASAIDANVSRLRAALGEVDLTIVRVPVLYASHQPPQWGDFAAAKKALASNRVVTEVQQRSLLVALPRDRFVAGLSGAQKAALVNPEWSLEALKGRGFMPDGSELGGLYPMAVNGVVAGRDHVIIPQQWGPVVGGQDILSAAVAEAYAAAGMTVLEVDDFETYHVLHGEVHCGSNSLREVPSRWW